MLRVVKEQQHQGSGEGRYMRKRQGQIEKYALMHLYGLTCRRITRIGGAEWGGIVEEAEERQHRPEKVERCPWHLRRHPDAPGQTK